MPAAQVLTFDECVVNAKRLLEFAEAETDLVKMERYEKLADSWTNLALVIHQVRNLSSYSFPMAPVDLSWLDAFSPAGFPPGTYPGSRTFYSPVDNVHGALVEVAARATTSLVVAMYGFDDDELAALIHDKIALPGCFVQLSLDSSQAGGVHERALLAKCDYPATSIAYGRSEKGAIMHMKVMIVDGLYLVDGSTNWSTSGESAQDNQLTVRADPLAAARARSRVDAIHDSMLMQMAAKAARPRLATVPSGVTLDPINVTGQKL